MCGIAGRVGEGPPELLPAMLDLLRYRGPDDSGAHDEPGVTLGMTRLAIIVLIADRGLYLGLMRRPAKINAILAWVLVTDAERAKRMIALAFPVAVISAPPDQEVARL